MSQPKVFEFAKEIGMETLALMDKIREWKLPVKSHMAELSPELMDLIKTKMDGDDKPSKAPAKKVARKKAPAKAAAPAKSAGKAGAKASASAPVGASATKKVVVKKSAVVRRKASDESEDTDGSENLGTTDEQSLSQQAGAAPAVAKIKVKTRTPEKVSNDMAQDSDEPSVVDTMVGSVVETVETVVDSVLESVAHAVHAVEKLFGTESNEEDSAPLASTKKVSKDAKADSKTNAAQIVDSVSQSSPKSSARAPIAETSEAVASEKITSVTQVPGASARSAGATSASTTQGSGMSQTTPQNVNSVPPGGPNPASQALGNQPAQRAVSPFSVRSGEIRESRGGQSQTVDPTARYQQNRQSTGARIISAPQPVVAEDTAGSQGLGNEASMQQPTDGSKLAPGATAHAAHPARPGEERKVHKPRIMREVVMTREGPVSGIKSEAPRRNIVGRMDLSRVAEMQKARQPATVSRTQRGTMRTGFVAQSQDTNPAPAQAPFQSLSEIELENRKKLEERNRKSRMTGTPVRAGEPAIPSATKEGEEAPPAFNASEFRKREMVFQPKKKKGLLTRHGLKTQITTPKASKRVVKMYQTIKVSDLAQEMGIKVPQLMKVLITNGIQGNLNSILDFDTVSLISPEFGFETQNMHKTDSEMLTQSAYGDLDATRIHRPPIVTIMGHVDHGKTTLLDHIRKAKVASGEAGGITQHIGAYQVTNSHGLVTFIDTPGHEAFTGMRARGANVTDIAIIVVAADDGVMPQTKEAIAHAKAAGVSIIVAVNKIDKVGANPERIKQQLTEFELVPEEWGGDTIFCEVSALNGTGVDNLLEQISLVAELQDLKANPMRSATGIVIESKVEKGRGNVATVLIKDGTLKIGEHFVCGTMAGKVRSLLDFQGKSLKEAGPSTPVEIIGLSEVPQAGDKFDSVSDEKTAYKVAEQRQQDKKVIDIKPANKMTLDDLFSKVKMGATKELPVILKTDVAGSLEAILGMFSKIVSEEVKVKVIHSGVGGINESDVLLAKTSGGVVVGFNVRPDSSAGTLAKQQGIEVKSYNIVYELIDDMKKALSGMLAPDVVEVVLGHAEVRNTFTVPKIGMIAGCYVNDGKIARSSQARLVRDGRVVYQGGISSLKRFKDDAREVLTGFECGIGIENFNDLKVGDVIEAFVREERQREL